MLFNSFEFLAFFAIVFALYSFFNHHWQNRLLLFASYVFYGFWDWRFLSLIFVSTIVDYYCGIKIDESKDQSKRRLFLVISLIVNLGILGFFKYFNFFTGSLINLFQSFGIEFNFNTLHIVLPVGISFYTFQTLSYTIDIYKKKLKPTNHFLDFALFVAFFPQLVAGPIERAKNLLPQILNKRIFKWEQFRQGCFLILWGLYIKIFIADNLANIVDPIFENASLYSSKHIWLALYAFAFQIYCDFAGYSHIARGLGRVMGFDIMVNFYVPYLAANPREFWQRWHISLSTWLKDYLYIPLGGSRGGTLNMYRNLFIVMLLGGLWHGAQWTFILWGMYHGALLILYRVISPIFRQNVGPNSQWKLKIFKMINIVFFFHLICIGWLFFRAQSIDQAFIMLNTILTSFELPNFSLLINFLPYLYFLFLIDYLQYKSNDIFSILKMKLRYQGLIFTCIVISLLLSTIHIQSSTQLSEMAGPKKFIYFQF